MESTTVVHQDGTSISTTTTPAAVAGPTEAALISGTAIAATLRAELKVAIEELQTNHNITPGLAVVLVGARPDSATYVRMKKKAAAEINIHSIDVDLPDTTTTEELLAEVAKLNADPLVHGILVQLPLPDQCDEGKILAAIAVSKDADGFSAENIGNLALRGGEPPLAVPCTPAGCIELLQRSDIEVAGKNAVVLGRSNIVGMPVAHLLMSMNATVTVCHSRTVDLPEHVRRADIIGSSCLLLPVDWAVRVACRSRLVECLLLPLSVGGGHGMQS